MKDKLSNVYDEELKIVHHIPNHIWKIEALKECSSLRTKEYESCWDLVERAETNDGGNAFRHLR